MLNELEANRQVDRDTIGSEQKCIEDFVSTIFESFLRRIFEGEFVFDPENEDHYDISKDDVINYFQHTYNTFLNEEFPLAEDSDPVKYILVEEMRLQVTKNL